MDIILYNVFRESEANPEEIEYVNIQEELNEQLLDQYKQVERVIGEWAGRLITGKLLSGYVHVCAMIHVLVY